ncbi:acyl-CoA dehydrogenase [Clostridium botulinum]|uniref:Acyl-CoA dehydrogenase n=5 Tax=Clostridium botulinum TaxID=1491 RepID=A0A0A0ILA2_CLOBO|nr:acyl-CoA dehydrogenase [Clostridium botulinum]KEI01599.1 acyl-CoA dehydrogenase [Clostridium botulinum C/D str. BKT75002]KEI07933.1 acyl-CoA dehydrogenase [Clostridium botulinum C/D str. BKT2873]KGM94267.1 acyl-CoA dehydrogenase [Clostridium botulinum D str. CCUG 7971]KGN00351.1 acyl-CoA dehydrogenase [Clostridium botulinum C/D str. DC5]KOC50672.1 acyl-CoA dehydrogenase [Clostridium botulinum]
MDFNLTREQQYVKQMVKEFVENEITPIAAETDATGVFPMEVYKKLGKYGIIGLPYPKEYGGTGGDYLSYILAVEEISKACGTLGISYSVNTSLCCGAIYQNGTEEQKKKYLPDLCSGKKIGSFGLTEPNAGTDASGAQTVAVRDGDNYILNGQKCFITNSPLAETFVIFAITDRSKGTKGISAFIVEKDFPGISIGKIEDKMGIRGAQVGEIILEDCVVPAENLLGKEGRGFGIAMKTLDGGRIGVAAQGLGLAEGAFDAAREYMKERKQFGKQLYKFQGIAWRMADMDLRIEQSRHLLYLAAMDKNDGRPYSVSAARAKLSCTDTAMYVTTEAVQLFGGYGYIKDYPVERMMRDAKITQIYEGTNEVQRMVISGSIFR